MVLENVIKKNPLIETKQNSHRLLITSTTVIFLNSDWMKKKRTLLKNAILTTCGKIYIKHLSLLSMQICSVYFFCSASSVNRYWNVQSWQKDIYILRNTFPMLKFEFKAIAHFDLEVKTMRRTTLLLWFALRCVASHSIHSIECVKCQSVLQ